MNNLSEKYRLTPADLFNDRTGQWLASGIPAQVLSTARNSITDMWFEGPGGWVYEFSALASEAQAQGDYLLTALLYGIAKYPTPLNASKKEAYRNQLSAYLTASKKFPFRFERKVALIPYRNITTPVVYHVLYAKNPKSAPVLLMSGGIDTYKMDIHNFCLEVFNRLDVTMLLMDIPGTGESQVALNPDNDEIYRGVIDIARETGNGKVGYYGNSFGAYWAVRLAFERSIDFALAVGAPLNKAYQKHDNSLLRSDLGMNGVFSVALGMDDIASVDDLWDRIGIFALENLEAWDNVVSAPLFLVNGSDDPYVPNEDITHFDSVNNIQTWLLDNAGHCAARRAKEVVPVVVEWLGKHIAAS